MRKSLTLLTAAVLLATLLVGCVEVDEKEVARIEKAAVSYYCEKYGVTETSSEAKAILGYSLFAYDTGNVLVTMGDGARVFYNGYDESFADDAQAEEITRALNTELIPALVQEAGLPDRLEMSSTNADELRYNERVISGEDEEASFFATYFDGDVRAYAQAEKLDVAGSIAISLTDDELADPDQRVQQAIGLRDAIKDAVGSSRGVTLRLKAADGTVPAQAGYVFRADDGAFLKLSPPESVEYLKYAKTGKGFQVSLPQSPEGVKKSDFALREVPDGESVVRAVYAAFDAAEEEKAEKDKTVKRPKHHRVMSVCGPVLELELSAGVPVNSNGNAVVGVFAEEHDDGCNAYMVVGDASQLYIVKNADRPYTASVDTSKTLYLWRGELATD